MDKPKEENRPVLSKKEIQEIIIAGIEGAQRISEEKQLAFQEMAKNMGVFLPPQRLSRNTDFEKFRKYFIERYAEVASENLSRPFDARRPLILTKENFLELFEHVPGIENLPGEYRQMLSDIPKMLADFVEDTLNTDDELAELVSQGLGYQSFWKWLGAVVELSKEKSVKPIELFSDKKNNDAITKKLYTRKEFVDRFDTLMRLILRPAFLNKLMYRLFQVFRKTTLANDYELQELEGMAHAYLPMLRTYLRPYIVKFNEYVEAEATRIYGPN